MNALSMCDRCGNYYFAAASTAELRLTFCSGMCEGRAMVPISALLQAKRDPETWGRKARIRDRINEALGAEILVTGDMR